MKNEAHVLPRMLESVLPIIDEYQILDTGSTDSSIKVVKDFFDAHGIQGNIVVDTTCTEIIDGEECFIYDKARNAALKLLEGKKGFGFWIDCDEQLVLPNNFNAAGFKDALNKFDFGNINVSYSSIYPRGSFFRITKPFYWEGGIHERLICKEKVRDFYSSDIIVIAREEGGTWKSGDLKKKFLTHAKVLKNDVQKYNRPRDVFYLAKSYLLAQEHNDALYWFEKRVEMTDGFNEERYSSQILIAEIKRQMKKNPSEIFWDYMKASEIDNVQADNIMCAIMELQENNMWEFAYILSKHCVETYHKKNPYPSRTLQVDAAVYDHKLLELHKINCIKTNRGEFSTP